MENLNSKRIKKLTLGNVPEIKSFDELASRLNSIQGEPRASVLIIHLYLEYYLNMIIERKIPKPKRILSNATFYNKLKLVEALDVLDDTLIYDLYKINEIRNKLAHNIEIESLSLQDEILNLIKQMKVYSGLKNADLIPWHGLFTLVSKNVFENVRISSIQLITSTHISSPNTENYVP